MTLVAHSSFRSLAPTGAPSMTRSSGNSMRHSSETHRQLSENSRQLSDAGVRVAAYLRRLYPQRTADNVAADTGLNSATIAKWLERESAPGGIAMLVLVAIYGPDFLGAVMEKAPAWLDASQRLSEASALAAELDKIQARLDAVRSQT